MRIYYKMKNAIKNIILIKIGYKNILNRLLFLKDFQEIHFFKSIVYNHNLLIKSIKK